MHRESVYVCTYAHGARRVVGRVRAWDRREAAKLFALELEVDGAGHVGPQEVTVRPSPRPTARARPIPRR